MRLLHGGLNIKTQSEFLRLVTKHPTSPKELTLRTRLHRSVKNKIPWKIQGKVRSLFLLIVNYSEAWGNSSRLGTISSVCGEQSGDCFGYGTLPLST